MFLLEKHLESLFFNLLLHLRLTFSLLNQVLPRTPTEKKKKATKNTAGKCWQPVQCTSLSHQNPGLCLSRLLSSDTHFRLHPNIKPFWNSISKYFSTYIKYASFSKFPMHSTEPSSFLNFVTLLLLSPQPLQLPLEFPDPPSQFNFTSSKICLLHSCSFLYSFSRVMLGWEYSQARETQKTYAHSGTVSCLAS